MDLIQTWCDRYYCTLHFDASLILTLTLIQGHRNVKKQNFCANYLTKFSIDVNGILYTIETC